MSLGYKLLILFFIIAIIPLLVGIIYFQIFAQTDVSNEYITLHETFLSNIQHSVNQFFEDAHKRLLSLAVSIQGYSSDEIKRKEAFKDFLFPHCVRLATLTQTP